MDIENNDLPMDQRIGLLAMKLMDLLPKDLELDSMVFVALLKDNQGGYVIASRGDSLSFERQQYILENALYRLQKKRDELSDEDSSEYEI